MQPIRSLTFCTCLFTAAIAHAETATAPGSDWSRAMKPLRDAIECKAPLKPTPAVRNVLHVPKGGLSGDYTLPEPLTVFGSLKVTAMSIFEDDSGAGYSIKPVGKLADIAKAARLKPDNGRYFRAVKGGHVEASEPMKGEVVVSCVLGENPGED